MADKILDVPGSVKAAPGVVMIDGKGHPIAAYTPDAATRLAERLSRAAEEAVRPFPEYIAADAGSTARNP